MRLAVSVEYTLNRKLFNWTCFINSCTAIHRFSTWTEWLTHHFPHRRIVLLEARIKAARTLYFLGNATDHCSHKNVGKPNESPLLLHALQGVPSRQSSETPFLRNDSLFLTRFQAHYSHIPETAVHSKTWNREVVAQNLLWATLQNSVSLRPTALGAAKCTFNTRYSRVSKTDGSLHRG